MERIDLHVHTLASDGSDAPETVVRKAAAAGLRDWSIICLPWAPAVHAGSFSRLCCFCRFLLASPISGEFG